MKAKGLAVGADDHTSEHLHDFRHLVSGPSMNLLYAAIIPFQQGCCCIFGHKNDYHLIDMLKSLITGNNTQNMTRNFFFHPLM